ncbi:MAG: hypothetical protein ACLT1W_15870 [Alistipes onderdonkii]
MEEAPEAKATTDTEVRFAIARNSPVPRSGIITFTPNPGEGSVSDDPSGCVPRRTHRRTVRCRRVRARNDRT